MGCWKKIQRLHLGRAEDYLKEWKALNKFTRDFGYHGGPRLWIGGLPPKFPKDVELPET